MPMEGKTYAEMGFDPDRRKQMMKRLQAAANPIGLKFNEDRNFAPNSIMAHLLTEYAEEHGGAAKQNEVADCLLKAFFGDGSKLDKESLLNLASNVGLDVNDVSKYITDPAAQQNLKRKATSWSRQGLNGVPFFFMNGRPTFSGAQEPEVFKSTILKIAEKHPLKQEGSEDKKCSL